MFHARGYRLPDQCMTMAIATMLSMKVFLQAMAAQDGSARQSLTALTGSARRQGCEGNAEISMAVTGNGQRTTDNGGHDLDQRRRGGSLFPAKRRAARRGLQHFQRHTDAGLILSNDFFKQLFLQYPTIALLLC